jgi:hypothetical protein
MGICTTKEKDRKFFELFFRGYEEGNEECKEKCLAALQAFMVRPKNIQKKAIQAQNNGITVSSDLPLITKDSFNLTVQSQNYDMGYEKVFKEVPLGANEDSWEIADAANSLTFMKVEEGQRIDVAGYTGSKVTAYVDYYGGALGWTDKMIRFRKIAMMLDMAETFRNKFWVNKANNFYSLIAAAAALNVTVYQGAAGDGPLQRDIQTINRAAFAVTNRCRNKGYGDMANAQLVMYFNPIDKDRVYAAFAVTANALAAAGRTGDTINYNITLVPTYNTFITAHNPVLVIPGHKIQMADAMAPTTYGPDFDILSLNRVQSVWAIYGGIIADTDQCEQFVLG